MERNPLVESASSFSPPFQAKVNVPPAWRSSVALGKNIASNVPSNGIGVGGDSRENPPVQAPRRADQDLGCGNAKAPTIAQQIHLMSRTPARARLLA
jgi:hypothetical protein